MSEIARHKELGEAATLAGRHGGQRFASGVSGNARRSVRATALVPVAKHEQDALAVIRRAEQRASNAQRLELAKARAAEVELREIQSQQTLETYGIIDGAQVFAKGSSDEPDLTVEPGRGRIQVGQWCPPIGPLCKARVVLFGSEACNPKITRSPSAPDTSESIADIALAGPSQAGCRP